MVSMFNRLFKTNEKQLYKFLIISYLVNIIFGIIFAIFFICEECGDTFLSEAPDYMLYLGALLHFITILLVIAISIKLIISKKYLKNFLHLIGFLIATPISLFFILFHITFFMMPFYLVGSLIILIISFVHYIVKIYEIKNSTQNNQI